jgi:hypothetical protein
MFLNIGMQQSCALHPGMNNRACDVMLCLRSYHSTLLMGRKRVHQKAQHILLNA